MAVARQQKRSITTTTNYRLFKISSENRSLDLPKHKSLRQSMREYGFLRSFPISCVRNGEKQLVVKDGQHRLAFAEELGLPVHYVVEDIDYDIAFVNATPKTWSVKDYAQKYADNGLEDYQEGIDFASKYSIPLGIAFCLLYGTTHFKNIQRVFNEGRYQIQDRRWAHQVADLYAETCQLSSAVRKVAFLKACMAVCRVDDFLPNRFLQNAHKKRDLLVSYGTRDAYLEMMETVYNFGRQQLVPLKIKAHTAMRERMPKGMAKAQQ